MISTHLVSRGSDLPLRISTIGGDVGGNGGGDSSPCFFFSFSLSPSVCLCLSLSRLLLDSSSNKIRNRGWAGMGGRSGGFPMSDREGIDTHTLKSNREYRLRNEFQSLSRRDTIYLFAPPTLYHTPPDPNSPLDQPVYDIERILKEYILLFSLTLCRIYSQTTSVSFSLIL